MSDSAKKALMISMDVILYVIGFPLLMVVAILCSMPYIKAGLYGLTACVPIILVVLVWVATGVTELVIRLVGKKKMDGVEDKKKALNKQGLKMIIAIFVCLTVFAIFLDIVLPPLLNKATQGTIKYEDIVMDGTSQSDKQRALFDKFVEWNVDNGNLNEKTFAAMDEEFGESAESVKATFIANAKQFRESKKTSPWRQTGLYKANDDTCFTAKFKDKIIAEYKKEALNCAEINTVIKKCFNSIDAAYQSFDPLSIELALEDMNFLFEYNHDALTDIAKVYWGDELGHSDTGDYELVDSDYKYQWCILDLIGSIPENEMIDQNLSLLDMAWKLHKDSAGNIATHNEKRGILDYMNMAWINSIGLLGIVSVTSIRNWFYFFSAVIILASLVRYFIARPAYYGVEFTFDKQKDESEMTEKELEKKRLAEEKKAAKLAKAAEKKAAKEQAKAEKAAMQDEAAATTEEAPVTETPTDESPAEEAPKSEENN